MKKFLYCVEETDRQDGKVQEKKIFRKNIYLPLLFFICILLALSACTSGSILSQQIDDTEISMQTERYTKTIQREITVENTQSGQLSIQLSRESGKIEIFLADEYGNTVLSVNQNSSLPQTPVYTAIANEGTYDLSVTMQQFSGSFTVQWSIENIEKE